ncbi:hypothetical protein KI387_026225, partial [Taxus chinensis]
PSVPDNVNRWQVFSDDHQFLAFLEQRDNFNNLFFKGSKNQHRESTLEEEKVEVEEVDSVGVLVLKGNNIPKGLVSLKELFDRHDRYVKDKAKEPPKSIVDFKK